MENTQKQIILTGDRPTGRLHLGHYVGSLKRRVELQNSGLYDEINILITGHVYGLVEERLRLSMFIIYLFDVVILSIEIDLQPAGELIIIRYRFSDVAVKIIQIVFFCFLKLFLYKIHDPGEAFIIIVIYGVDYDLIDA